MTMSPCREVKGRIRELERQLGRKTMEVEILKEALDKARPEKPIWLAQSQSKDGSGVYPIMTSSVERGEVGAAFGPGLGASMLSSEQEVVGTQRPRDVVEQDRHLGGRVPVRVHLDEEVGP